jgi:membrane-bound lytic murein transglycosylase D
MFVKLFLTSAIFLIVATSSYAESTLHAASPITEQQEHTTNAQGIVLEFIPVVDLWDRIRQGYALTPLQSPLTTKHEDWYAARPDYMQRMISRSERYLHYIVEEVEKRNMPTEIALLPMIESGFNPLALSRSRASGIWQFMPVTGKYFGLEQNWWADHRRDVTAATDAALDYLQKLHLMFGNWDLALAAYNAGEGTVRRAIESNRKKGLSTDYQSLQLSEETRNYVPKLQAMKNLISEPEKYGLSINSIPDQPYFTKVMAPEKIDASLAASLAEIPYDEFAALNPEYNRPVLVRQGQHAHEILLPISSADIFLSNLANYDQPLVSWQTYQAKRGEQLEKIASKFGISTTELRQVNDLTERKTLASNRLILVPGFSPSTQDADDIKQNKYEILNAHFDTELKSKESIRHEVAPNETLYAIALRYGVTVQQIMASNQLKSSRLKVGQVLVIIGSKKTAIQKQAAFYHSDLI